MRSRNLLSMVVVGVANVLVVVSEAVVVVATIVEL